MQLTFKFVLVSAALVYGGATVSALPVEGQPFQQQDYPIVITHPTDVYSACAKCFDLHIQCPTRKPCAKCKELGIPCVARPRKRKGPPEYVIPHAPHHWETPFSVADPTIPSVVYDTQTPKPVHIYPIKYPGFVNPLQKSATCQGCVDRKIRCDNRETCQNCVSKRIPCVWRFDRSLTVPQVIAEQDKWKGSVYADPSRHAVVPHPVSEQVGVSSKRRVQSPCQRCQDFQVQYNFSRPCKECEEAGASASGQ